MKKTKENVPELQGKVFTQPYHQVTCWAFDLLRPLWTVAKLQRATILSVVISTMAGEVTTNNNGI